MSYVKFQMPDKLRNELKMTLSQIADARESRIRKGMNEVTKAIERGIAKLVVMAEDVTPAEILFHVPLLCEEKGIPYAYLVKKADLGNAVKINVPASSIAVEKLGIGNEDILLKLIEQINALKK